MSWWWQQRNICGMLWSSNRSGLLNLHRNFIKELVCKFLHDFMYCHHAFFPHSSTRCFCLLCQYWFHFTSPFLHRYRSNPNDKTEENGEDWTTCTCRDAPLTLIFYGSFIFFPFLFISTIGSILRICGGFPGERDNEIGPHCWNVISFPGTAASGCGRGQKSPVW